MNSCAQNMQTLEPRFFDGTPALVEQEIAKVTAEIAEAGRSIARAIEHVLKAEACVEEAKILQRNAACASDTAGSELRKLRAKVVSMESNRDVYAAEAYTAHMYKNSKEATLAKLKKKLRLLISIELNPVRSAHNKCFSEANMTQQQPANTEVVGGPSARISESRIGRVYVPNRNRHGYGRYNTQNIRACLGCKRTKNRNGSRLFLYHGPDGRNTLCDECKQNGANR